MKREWLTEKNTDPLPFLHEIPSSSKIAFSRISIVLTIIFWLVYVSSVIFRQLVEGPNTYQFILESFGYLLVVTLLTFSALMYLLARQGAFLRFKDHVRVSRPFIDEYFSKNHPSITVLVPSYNEEISVIRKTLLSAALQEFPNIRVVLLVDDDEKRISKENMKKFRETQNIGNTIREFLKEPRERFIKALKAFENSELSDKKTLIKKSIEVEGHYIWAAEWLRKTAKKEKLEDHVDIFFVEQVYLDLAKELESVAKNINESRTKGFALSKPKLLQLYRRLSWIFDTDVEVFERKKYVSLSHESNKAMNLNSYIGLMGCNYRFDNTEAGIVLTPVKNESKADLLVPDSDFLLTLDADSVLLRDYCLRLVYLLQQPNNADVAVTQTPYSSFRGAPSRIERLAGATTDVQHILHQGMTYYNATFWVGANAVIRKKALDDIVEKEWVGGFEIKRYVQDRTVIEDTESSIDMALKGWRLVNYPERLSYSATPPDFGSLVVQRRRWANGGLIIMPKLLTLMSQAKHQGNPISRNEFLLRTNYMSSIAWASFGLVFLLAYPYDGRLLSPLVLLAAAPYFVAMAADLKSCRYSAWDVLNIYGFNLILLPVNLAGVFKSLQQMITTQKIPFARTPKVKNRTATGLLYLLSPIFIIGFSLFTFWRNVEGENWGNAAFAGFNALTATWAVIAYIGIGNFFIDLGYGLINMLYVEVEVEEKKLKKKKAHRLNWKTNLFHNH